MQFFDPNNPNEKKKMIAAAVLALVAIIVLGYVFFGGGSSKPPTNQIAARPSPTARAGKLTSTEESPVDDSASIYQEVIYNPAVPAVADANRNIFAYYEPPPPTPRPVIIPTASPTPTPPLMVSSLAPPTVYAGTPADFTLQVTGDKFTPAVHVILDGRDLPTRFINSQQLFATVSQTLIKNAGVRQVMARSNDGNLYSNTITLNVTQPPQPNYTYVGIIGKPRFNDTAVLQDKTSKDFIRVQRGDPIGGRFRVVSISEKEVVLIDSTLKIQHRLGFTADQNSNSGFRPPVRSVDDEP